MKRMRAAEDQLDARSLERFTRRELLQLIRESRREYEKKRALLFGTSKRDKMVRPPTTNSVSTLKPSVGPSVDSDSSLHRTENPSKTQPFPHRNERGTASGSMEGGAPPRHELESEIPNQPSETDKA